MKNIIRIGNGQGFWGDSIDAPVNLVKDGPLDYLTLDYLAEVTLSIMQRQKLKNPNAGYARDFIDLVGRILPEIQNDGLKVITNAGGVNPNSCRDELLKLSKSTGNPIKIGVIQGDDIFPTLANLRKQGVAFENMDTGDSFDSIVNKVYSVNVYINSSTIAEALDKGAQIVLAGRVSDPGLALGPCIYEFGWNIENYNKILKSIDEYKGIICGDDYEFSYEELLIKFEKAELNKILVDNKTTDCLIYKDFIFHPGITLAMSETKLKIKKFESGFFTGIK